MTGQRNELASPSRFTIGGRRVLLGEQLRPATLHIEAGRIVDIAPGQRERLDWDAGDLALLPGIVDLHGDAFERDLQPRPKVDMPVDMALLNVDRQLVANGITTAYYGITCSWEPGLRDSTSVRVVLAALERLRSLLAADARVHLRWETYNVDAVDEIAEFLRTGQIHLLAFNDHTRLIYDSCADPVRLGRMSLRTGLDADDFAHLTYSVVAREAEVPQAMRRMAEAARSAGVKMASHDDPDAAVCAEYHTLGCQISDFPVSIEAMEAAVERNMMVVLGAPNVIRGGSHLKGLSASTAVIAGHCDALASDYYYPAMLAAPYHLVARGMEFGSAWRRVSAGPAHGAGLTDRGELAVGQRADFILVQDHSIAHLRALATFVAGRCVFQTV